MRRGTRCTVPSQGVGGNSAQAAKAAWDRAVDDLDWACNDPELQQRFEGEFVVVRGRTVVAHGYDRIALLREALGMGYAREELVVVPIFALAAENPPDIV